MNAVVALSVAVVSPALIVTVSGGGASNLLSGSDHSTFTTRLTAGAGVAVTVNSTSVPPVTWSASASIVTTGWPRGGASSLSFTVTMAELGEPTA